MNGTVTFVHYKPCRSMVAWAILGVFFGHSDEGALRYAALPRSAITFALALILSK
jgi:hypothetical protein